MHCSGRTAQLYRNRLLHAPDAAAIPLISCNDGPNTVELSLGYAKENLSLLAAIFVAGNDYDKMRNILKPATSSTTRTASPQKQLSVPVMKITMVTSEGENIALVNTGISVSKDRYTASYVYNPDTEKSHLVFMASF